MKESIQYVNDVIHILYLKEEEEEEEKEQQIIVIKGSGIGRGMLVVE